MLFIAFLALRMPGYKGCFIALVIAAMFTYNLCQKTGAMDLIKKMLTSVTNDKRVLVLILAWGFGGFMEAVAGFGTAVAIPAAIMVGLGFDPMKGMLGFTLLASLSYVIPALAVAHFVGAEFVDLVGNTVSLILIVVAANMAGGAIGKLISPQSIAVAIAAIGLEGADGKIMAQTVKYCLAFGLIVCVLSFIMV